MLTTTATTCSACGGSELRHHFHVAAEAGPQGLSPATDRFGTALADIARCAACGHMQLERMPSEADLRDAYGYVVSDDYIDEEPGQRATARRLLQRVEGHVRRGRLLDLGCWVGFTLAEARDRGWEVVGVEPSEFASRYARERLRLEVLTADLFTAEVGGRRFDAIVLADVLEHLPRPRAALERVASLLEPDGVLCIVLPDAGSVIARAMGRHWWSVIPTHVQYFTRGSMATVLRRSGFEPLEFATAPKAFSVGYYLGRVEGYSQSLGRALASAAERAGLAQRMWAPDFHDRMLVIARTR